MRKNQLDLNRLNELVFQLTPDEAEKVLELERQGKVGENGLRRIVEILKHSQDYALVKNGGQRMVAGVICRSTHNGRGSELVQHNASMVLGVNVQNPHPNCNSCAESNAVSTAVFLGAQQFEAVVVWFPDCEFHDSAPCMLCRQLLVRHMSTGLECNGRPGNMKVVSVYNNETFRTWMLSDLYPDWWMSRSTREALGLNGEASED